MAGEELQIVIEAVNRATAQLREVEGSLVDLNKKAQDSENAFGAAGRSVAGYLAAFATIGTVVGLMKSSINAALESEQVTARLRNTIENAGVSFARYGETINAAIQSASRYGVVQDEVVSAALQRMILITGDVAGSVQRLNLVMNLAESRGIDLSTAADYVSRAMQGNIAMLGRMFPELQRLSDELGENADKSEIASRALEIVAQKTRDAAGNIPEATRALREFNIQWEELGERLGTKVLPKLTDFLTWLNRVTSSWGEFLRLIPGVVIVEGVANAFGRSVLPARDLASAVEKIGTAAQTALPGLQQLDRGVTASAALWRDEFGLTLNNTLADFRTGVQHIVLDDSVQFNTAISGMSESMNQFGLRNTMTWSDITSIMKTESEKQKAIEDARRATILSSLSMISSSALSQNRTLYAISRAAGIAQAIISTRVAATRALEVPPPWFGMALAATIYAAGMANVAAIVSAPKPMALGGIVTQPTLALIGERGPEAVVPLGRGDRTMNESIVINFTGPVLGDAQQARQFAIEIDKQLYELKNRNISMAFA